MRARVKTTKHALLLYPEYPETFWSFKYALKFISKKAAHPPLGLLTIAAMLPDIWKKKIVDLNVKKLKDKEIKWADYVLISSMAIQKESVQELINRCKQFNKKIIVGGPLFTAFPDDFKMVDHIIMNEAEVTLPQFIDDLKKGKAKRIYSSNEFPDMSKTPIPMWELINMKKYASMNIQYSRGCPFNCDFCDITTLFGRHVRTKSKYHLIAELDKLREVGWKGRVFFVDDNFIGNKNLLKQEILPALKKWMVKWDYPFTFNTEASINLSDDHELMKMMVDVGFDSVFVGIESPQEESLAECSKHQNIKRNLVDSVKKIQRFGLEVSGGFIIGFDNDLPSIFEKQIQFIQKSGIVTAMVGLLNAPKNTALYKRLQKEHRLLKDHSGNNTDFSMNFIPKMDYAELVKGYKEVLAKIYSPKPYYERVKEFLRNKRPMKVPRHFQIGHIKALLKSVFVLGIWDNGREYYWKLFFWTLLKKPNFFPMAMTFAIYGFHFRKIFGIVV